MRLWTTWAKPAPHPVPTSGAMFVFGSPVYHSTLNNTDHCLTLSFPEKNRQTKASPVSLFPHALSLGIAMETWVAPSEVPKTGTFVHITDAPTRLQERPVRLLLGSAGGARHQTRARTGPNRHPSSEIQTILGYTEHREADDAKTQRFSPRSVINDPAVDRP